MIEPAPEGLNFSREAWAAMPAELRSEIIPAVRLIASATVRFIGVAITLGPIANAPAGFVQRS